jgi:hypothetical protein
MTNHRQSFGDILVDKPTPIDTLSFDSQNRGSFMGIQVIKTERLMQGEVRLVIEVRTSVGRMDFPVDIHDRGSLAENERQAFLELQKLLEEALALVQQRLA